MFENSFNVALIVIAIIGICGAALTILIYKLLDRPKKR